MLVDLAAAQHLGIRIMYLAAAVLLIKDIVGETRMV
jgi:hypothetical protein